MIKITLEEKEVLALLAVLDGERGRTAPTLEDGLAAMLRGRLEFAKEIAQ